MRSSLVALQLFLAFALVWATSVPEEKKECCGPGVPPEESCCPKGNATSQEAGKTAGTNSEEPKTQETVPAVGAGKLSKKAHVPAEPTSEELEERGEEHRERMQHSSSPYEFMFLKDQALNYFNERRSDAHYRPLEDTNIKVKRAIGTILTFPLFLVNTNCTKEEGRRLSIPWYARPKADPCVALPKHEQKKLKCSVSMFLNAKTRQSTVVEHECQPVAFWEDSDDTLDLNHLMDFSAMEFGQDF